MVKYENFLKCKKIQGFIITSNHERELKNIFLNENIVHNDIDRLINMIRGDVKGCWLKRYRYIKYKLKRDAFTKKSCVIRHGYKLGMVLWQERIKSVATTKEKYLNNHTQQEWEKLRESKASIGRERFIKRYGEKEGVLLWNDYLKRWKEGINKKKKEGWKNGRTLEEFQQKYGLENGYNRWKKRNLQQSQSISKVWKLFPEKRWNNTIEKFIEKYGEIDGKIKYNSLREKCKHQSSKEYFIEKYGEREGIIKYEDRINKLKYVNTEKFYIEKYGPIVGPLKRRERYLKLIFFPFHFNRVSKISQRFFWEIYLLLEDDCKNLVYFYELNEEYKIYPQNTKYFVFFCDFKINNIIIEFNGEYWHSLEKQKEKDNFKREYFKQHNYKLLEINEKEYKEFPRNTVQKCINFINGEIEK